jgi:hypothetical protein
VIRAVLVEEVCTSGSGLDEYVMHHVSHSTTDENPSVEALTGIFIIRLVIWLVIIDVVFTMDCVLFFLFVILFGLLVVF